MRFSDEVLAKFHRDFILHVERFDKHERNEHAKFDALIEAQKANTKAINELTISVTSLVIDTKDIIQMHRDFQGTVRLGSRLQRFVIWFGVVGGAIAASIVWFKNL